MKHLIMNYRLLEHKENCAIEGSYLTESDESTDEDSIGDFCEFDSTI